MILEYNDIKPFVDIIAKDLEKQVREQLEQEVFIAYPHCSLFSQIHTANKNHPIGFN